MKKITAILSIAAMVLFASCEREPAGPESGTSEDEAIGFTTSFPEGWAPVSKAINVDSAYLSDNGFGVYAYYTGSANYTGASSVEGVVLDNRKVWFANDSSYNTATSTWTATGSKAWRYYGPYYPGGVKYKEYWPMRQSEKMTFFAYAPWNTWNSQVSVAEKGAVPTINYQLFTNGQGGASQSGSTYTVTVANSTFGDTIQKDLLWGVQSTGYPYKDFQRPASNTAVHQQNTVDFKFRHALSKLSFTIATEDLPADPAQSTLDDFAYYNYVDDSYPLKTVYLVESVEIWSDDGLFRNSATLSLDNTTDANSPEWSSKAGNVKYNFTSSIFDNDIKYVKDESQEFNYSNNRTNFSTLISGRTDIAGIGTDPHTLMGNASNRLYAIPGSGQLKVRVKYHKVTFFYYYRNYYNRYWTVYEPEDGDAVTVEGTLDANLEAGRSYNINLVLKGIGGNDVDITLEVQPWEVLNRTYSYSEDDYEVIDWLTFDSEWIDYRVDNLVYINNRVGKFTFRVKGGKYVRWMAELRPSPEGDGTDGFRFTDRNGVPLTYTDGTELDELYGELGENVYNEIYVQARNLEAPKINAATLRFTFDNNATPLEAVVPLNLINQYYNGTTKRIQEWTVVQNAN